MRKIFTAIAALCMAASSLPAAAGVVYNWVELEGDPVLGRPIVGRIEFTDEAWKKGFTSFSLSSQYWVRASDIGVLSLFLQGMGTVIGNTIPCGQVPFPPVDPEGFPGCAALGYSPDDLLFQGPYRMGGDLAFGALLSGSFGADNSLTGFFDFFGTGPETPISFGDTYREHTDPPCNRPQQCVSRGVWALDLSTIPVAEPPTAFALLAGLVALLSVRLRRWW
jgi:hypothetical protein